MKKTFCATLVAAVLLALGPISQAQETTSTVPSEDASTTEKAQVLQEDSQASVSDEAAVEGKVEIVEPVVPVEEQETANSQAAIGTSDCVGCGQALPKFGVPAYSSCGSCEINCCGCEAIQVTTYFQPTTSCGCSQIGLVAYDQPILQSPTISSAPSNWVASPVSVVTGTSSCVNPAASPVPMTVYTPTQCGCSSCGSGYGPATTVGRGFLTGNCTDCVPTRRQVRRGIFRYR